MQVVELAIVMPVLLLLVFGVLDLGRGLSASLIITTAARQGARVAAQGKSIGEIVTAIQDEMTGLPLTLLEADPCTSAAPETACVTTSDLAAAAGTPITVSVRYHFKYAFLPRVLAGIGAPALSGGTTTLTAQAVMRRE